MVRHFYRLTTAFLIVCVCSGVSSTYAASVTRPQGSWPVCRTAAQSFCVEDFQRDGISVFTDNDAVYVEGSAVHVEVHFVDVNTIAWSVSESDNASLPGAAAGSYFQVSLRTSDLAIAFTEAVAERFYTHTEGTAQTGYHLIIEGSPAEVNWRTASGFSCEPQACGNQTTQADLHQWRFSGKSVTSNGWSAEQSANFSGAYVASNAQRTSGLPAIEYPANPAWLVQLANPHLAVNAQPASGSFTAFIPSGYFTGLGMEANIASAAGLRIERQLGSESIVLQSAASSLDDGMYYRVPEISYSNPRLRGVIGSASAETLIPDAPVLQRISARPGTVELGFIPPRFDGGSPLTHYLARCQDAGVSVDAEVPVASTEASLSGLSGKALANCSVFAFNRYGMSAPSNARSVWVASARAPSTPLNLQLMPADGGVTVQFEPPVSDGGSPLTGFSLRCWQGEYLIQMVKLANNVFSKSLQTFVPQYPVNCVVAALNGVGQSVPTDPVTVVPSGSLVDGGLNTEFVRTALRRMRSIRLKKRAVMRCIVAGKCARQGVALKRIGPQHRRPHAKK